jgi:hypothetical protein
MPAYAGMTIVEVRYDGVVIERDACLRRHDSLGVYATSMSAKFKGMDKNMFKLYLKECEFRFNDRGKIKRDFC